jgi:hypothetical protein
MLPVKAARATDVMLCNAEAVSPSSSMTTSTFLKSAFGGMPSRSGAEGGEGGGGLGLTFG